MAKDTGNDPTLDHSKSERAPSELREGKLETSQQETEDQDWPMNLEDVQVDLRRAIVGGVLAAAVALFGGLLVGEASGAEGRTLLEVTLSSTRSFCGTVTLALGNILALMLTLLSLSASTDTELKWTHYQRVKQISWLVSVVLTASILIYLLLNVPLEQSDTASKPTTDFGFSTLYYVTLVLSSLLAGALITIVLMLFNTVRDIINVIGLRQTDHPLVRSEEENSG